MSGFDVFAAREFFGGKPRNLYTFARADKMWRYNSVGRVVSLTYGITTIDYAPALITRGRIQRANDAGALQVHLKIARTVPVADELRKYSTFPMYCGIHRWQDYGDAGMLPPLQHFGAIANVQLNEGFVECDIVSGETIFSQPFPSKIFSRQCQLGTYTGRCGVDERQFSTPATILSIDGRKITLDFTRPTWTRDDGWTEDVPDNWYDGGQIAWADDAATPRERVYIERAVGSEMTILGALPDGAAVGDSVNVIAGDDHSLSTCKFKFNNVLNFFGFDRLPLEDPIRTQIPVGFAPPGSSAVPQFATGPISLNASQSETPDDATIELDVLDSSGVVTAVEYRYNNVGFPAGITAWADMPVVTPSPDPATEPTIYGVTVPKGDGGFVFSEVRVTYTDPDSGLPVQRSTAFSAFSGFELLPGESDILVENGPICIAANGPGAVCLDYLAVGDSDPRIVFLTMTANRALFFSNMATGSKGRIVIDATAGPFTLTLATETGIGGPTENHNSAGFGVITIATVTGYAVLDFEKLGDGFFSWTDVVNAALS